MRGIVCSNPLGLDDLEGTYPNILANYRPQCVDYLERDPLGYQVNLGDPFLQYIEFPVKTVAGKQTFVILGYHIEQKREDLYLVYPLKVYDIEQWKESRESVCRA